MVSADPQFPFKVLMEELVGVSACLVGDMASRPNFSLSELDFVFSTLIVGSILNFMLMYILAPTTTTLFHRLPSIFANSPASHMFESGPWKGKLITFSRNPKLQTVEGDSLREKTESVKRMEWGIYCRLQMTVDGNLRPDQMIKRLFVSSDIEFDQASTNRWLTDYEAIVRKFRERGYGECVPEIVFWNLTDSRATLVPAKEKGVALVSGFSKHLMSSFLEEGGELNPEDVMEEDGELNLMSL